MVGLEGRDRAISTFILTLHGIRGIGPRKIQGLLDANREKIEGKDVLDREFAASLDEKLEYAVVSLDDDAWDDLEEKADRVLDRAGSEGISVLHPFMETYPMRMLANRKHPPILYCLGNVEALNSGKSVAVVGTRQPTEFGARMGRRLAEVLAGDGYAVVSGLALGSDTMAHEGALDAEGETIAVLPTPIDAPVYPKSNQGLAERILYGGGALVSEYAPGTKLHERQLVSNLVARDEWQPALADGLIVTETSKTGGTNHALRHALDTATPIAVFDYSSKRDVPFFEDERFGGNVEYLNAEKAFPIYGPSTIDEFKKRMDAHRAKKLAHPCAPHATGASAGMLQTSMDLS